MMAAKALAREHTRLQPQMLSQTCTQVLCLSCGLLLSSQTVRAPCLPSLHLRHSCGKGVWVAVHTHTTQSACCDLRLSSMALRIQSWPG